MLKGAAEKIKPDLFTSDCNVDEEYYDEDLKKFATKVKKEAKLAKTKGFDIDILTISEHE